MKKEKQKISLPKIRVPWHLLVAVIISIITGIFIDKTYDKNIEVNEHNSKLTETIKHSVICKAKEVCYEGICRKGTNKEFFECVNNQKFIKTEIGKEYTIEEEVRRDGERIFGYCIWLFLYGIFLIVFIMVLGETLELIFDYEISEGTGALLCH